MLFLEVIHNFNTSSSLRDHIIGLKSGNIIMFPLNKLTMYKTVNSFWVDLLRIISWVEN